MTRIFLTTEIPEEKTAASKARIDVLDILKSEGYKTLYLPRKMNVKNVLKFWKELSKIAVGKSHIMIEYPCWQKKRMYIVYLFCKLKGIKLYAVIHDISSLRLQTSPWPDMAILKLFDGLISHNSSMSEWITGHGYRKKLVNLDAFDYILEAPKNFNQPSLNGKMKLFYAGNLAYEKARFVYEPELGSVSKVELNLYGQSFSKEKMNGSKVNYKGLFNPGNPDLPENYHFGLIWEGTSLDTCNGQLGDYIRYNNPHKFSLYIALGLPVIVWKEAAVARFVTKNNIGLTISSLRDLEQISEKVRPEDYAQYVNNIQPLAEKVRNGFFLKAALNKLVNE